MEMTGQVPLKHEENSTACIAWHDIPLDRKLFTTTKISNLKSHEAAEFLTYHEIQPVQRNGPGDAYSFYYLPPWRCIAIRAVNAK